MSDDNQLSGVQKLLPSEDLKLFMAAIADIDYLFCKVMGEKVDFNLKLEIHGNNGELLHIRSGLDEFRRPNNGKSGKKS